MAGWDRRPRMEDPVPWEKYQKPGAGIGEVLRHADSAGTGEQSAMPCAGRCRTINRHPQPIIIYAWNEHDEGGYLCPTLNENGTPNASRLDAISAMKRMFRVTPPCRATRRTGKETAGSTPSRAI